jgi:hypothetical protein
MIRWWLAAAMAWGASSVGFALGAIWHAKAHRCDRGGA